MKKKKRYILLQLEKSGSLENFSDIKIISHKDNHAIVLCDLEKLKNVILSLEKKFRIISVSGTLKTLRSRV